jgi:hypothetical protein
MNCSGVAFNNEVPKDNNFATNLPISSLAICSIDKELIRTTKSAINGNIAITSASFAYN